MQLIPAVCMLHSVVIMAFLGIDRLICVAKPIAYGFSFLVMINPSRYRKISSSKRFQFYYILALNLVPILYTTFMVATSYTGMMKDPNKLVSQRQAILRYFQRHPLLGCGCLRRGC